MTNLALYYVCRKRQPKFTQTSLLKINGNHSSNHVDLGPTTSEKSVHALQLKPLRSDGSAYSSDPELNCCCPNDDCGGDVEKATKHSVIITTNANGSTNTLDIVERGNGGSCWEEMPKTLLLSICSSIIPVAYTNDYR